MHFSRLVIEDCEQACRTCNLGLYWERGFNSICNKRMREHKKCIFFPKLYYTALNLSISILFKFKLIWGYDKGLQIGGARPQEIKQ